MSKLRAVACAACLLTLHAQAAEIEVLDVDRSDGRIRVYSELLLAAPPALVFDALTDYDRFSELSTRYKESRFVEPAPDGTPRIYTRVEGCVWFFCRTVSRYALLELRPPEEIVATAEPAESDVAYGVEQWVLSADSAGTRVVYSHEMEPRFWVPPLIGVWAIRRVLERDAGEAAARIEALALTGQTKQTIKH